MAADPGLIRCFMFYVKKAMSGFAERYENKYFLGMIWYDTGKIQKMTDYHTTYLSIIGGSYFA